MKNIMKRMIAFVLCLALVTIGLILPTQAADAVTPIAIVHYGKNSPLNSYENISKNAAGGLVYGNNNSGVYNPNGRAIDITVNKIGSGYDQNYNFFYFDQLFSVQKDKSYCFAILYQTENATSKLFSGNGYYVTNTGNGVLNPPRPDFATQTVSVYGVDYYLAVATAAPNALTSGQKIAGVRCNTIGTSAPYSVYSAGVFHSADEAISYYTEDLYAPKFFSDMRVEPSKTPEGNYQLSWNAAFDSFTDTEDLAYHIYLSESPLTDQNLADAPIKTSVTGKTVTVLNGISESAVYSVAITATDTVGNTGFWFAENPITFGNDTAAPVFPDNMAIYDAQSPNGSFTLSWPSAKDNMTAAAKIRYEIYLSVNPLSAENLSSADFNASVTGGTEVAMNGLKENDRYYVAVSATDQADNETVWYSKNARKFSSLGISSPLALMNVTSDDENAVKPGGVVTATLGTTWTNSTVSWNTAKDGATVRAADNAGWAALYLDRPYITGENQPFYVAVVYETDSGTADFSASLGYCYRSKQFLPITDGSARLSWNYRHSFIGPNGKHYSIAYAFVDDAAAGVEIFGVQIALKANTDYTFHSAGVFRNLPSITDYYASFEKTSQKQLENMEELLTPIWSGNTVYEESVFPMTNEQGSMDPVSLIYPIDAVLCVRDAAKSITYVEGRDYTVQGGKLIINPYGSIHISDYDEYYFNEAGDGRKQMSDGSGRYTYFVEGTYWHFRQIVVTYRHSGTWKGDIPTGQAYRLPKTMKKLQNKERLNVVVTGYSNTTGCSVSSFIKAQPYLKNWADMTIDALKNTFDDPNITMVNTAVGGTTAAWALENVQQNIIDHHPDLVFLENGLNDPVLSTYRDNMKAVVAAVKAALPECEIVLVQSSMANPDVSGHYAHQEAFVNVLWQIANSYEGIAVANVATVHDYTLSMKAFADTTGNNVNHVNDFLERVYVQTIMKTFEYESGSLAIQEPGAFTVYGAEDVGGVKPSGAYVVDRGSVYVGGNSDITVDYSTDHHGVHAVTTAANGWVGMQFDSTYVTNGDPYYVAVLYSNRDQVFSMFYKTAGYLYTESSVTSFNPATAHSRLPWRYDFLGNYGGNDYFIGYYRVCDTPANTKLSGLQVILNTNVDYYFSASGIFDTYEDMIAAFRNECASKDPSSRQYLTFARFNRSDIGGVKPSGYYHAARGSILCSSDQAVFEYDSKEKAVRFRSSADNDWIALLYDAPYTTDGTPVYAAMLFTADDNDPFSRYGYTYSYHKDTEFNVLGNNIGRIAWEYASVDLPDGTKGCLAFAKLDDIPSGTELVGMQVMMNANVDYRIRSAGLFADYGQMMAAFADQTAPQWKESPVFETDGETITVVADATDETAGEMRYRLYLSKQPITDVETVTVAASGNDGTLSVGDLEYGTGYYAAVEALDAFGNSAVCFCEKILYTPVTVGDVNADKKITADDILALKGGLLCLADVPQPFADINGDGVADVRDLVRLKKMMVTDDLLSFQTLGLQAPHVVKPAEVVFGTYQNMDQLAENPEAWRFIRQYADGILFHEAYWLNANSPQSTYGRMLGDILADSNLKICLEYGLPKNAIDPVVTDDGTVYGYDNAVRIKERIDGFESATGLKIDTLNLEYYSGAVTSVLGKLGLEKNWENHFAVGVPFILKTYDAFYEKFIADFPDVKINHVGCPNLTGWVKETDGGTVPRYWQAHYSQSYWTSYQAYDITIPIFEKYAADGIHIGWVHDSPWDSFNTPIDGSYDTQNDVIAESLEIIRNRFGLNSTLLVTDWKTDFDAADADPNAIDRYLWENNLKSIFNAQYQGADHDQYLLESYHSGPFKMISENDPYTYANLVKTVLCYLKGIGQNLDLAITPNGGTAVGAGIYSSAPAACQTVQKSAPTETYTVTVTNNGTVDCNPWLRAVENAGGATVTYRYKNRDITAEITSESGFVFKDLFENADGDFAGYYQSENDLYDTGFDTQNHGLKPGTSVEIEVTVSGGQNGAVALCGFYNPQDSTDTIKDVVTIRF